MPLQKWSLAVTHYNTVTHQLWLAPQAQSNSASTRTVLQLYRTMTVTGIMLELQPFYQQFDGEVPCLSETFL